MGQDIKIGVEANTNAAESAVKKLDTAAEGAADAVSNIGKAAKTATDNLQHMEEMARRVKSAQAILSREFGRPISTADAQTATSNFERARAGRSASARRLRGFDSFESWYHGHATSYRRSQDADSHRRFVMAQTMQGTADSRNNGAPPPGGGNNPPPPPGGGGGGFAAGLQRSRSVAMGFVKGGLALAGIGSVMGMAGNAVNMATEESTGTDTLKRRMGDLGTNFDRLRDQVRGAGDGLGVSYVEMSRLAQQFTRVAGNLTAADLDGRDFQKNLRTSIGFSRAFGLDPAEGTQFFGGMRRLGVTGDDQSNRRLALLIADAVEKGGYGGKADEVLAAISDFATQASRISLSTGNVPAFAGALSSMTGTGYAGLDPAGAAAILGQADAATRRGGAYGQASMNFSFAAMNRGLPGINPVTAMGLMEGGLFGSTQGVYGRDADGKFNSPLGEFYSNNNIATPKLSGQTNFSRMMPMLRQQYGNSPWLLDAVKNQFGLQSHAQAAALLNVKPDSLDDMSGMLDKAGLKLSDLKDTSYAGLASIANAKTPAALQGLYRSVRGRKDLSEGERGSLDQAYNGGNMDDLRSALVKVVGTHEQVETEGSKTRDSIKSLQDSLTAVGALLLTPLNKVRDAVVAMAMISSPEYRKAAQEEEDAKTDYAAKYRARGGLAPKILADGIASDRLGADRLLSGGMSPGAVVDTQIPKPDPSMAHGPLASPGQYENTMARRQALQEYVRSKAMTGAMSYFRSQGWTRQQSAGIVGNLWQESGLDPSKVGDNGQAMGIAQWHPDRQKALREFAKNRGMNASDLKTQLAFVQYELQTTEKAAAARLRATDNASDAAWAYVGAERPATVNGAPNGIAGRVDTANALAGTPLPDGDPAGKAAAGGSPTQVQFGEAVVVIKDRDGIRGTATLKPSVQATPSGSR
jgi:hypothetical protein